MSNYTVKIKRNTDGDSRTAERVPTFEQFYKANREHREHVDDMMSVIARLINQAGSRHDYTKVTEPYESQFYRNLCDAIEGKINFGDGEWCKIHYEKERHHLNHRCPEYVNLIDVLEMICDCVCAAMARKGEMTYGVEIDSEILQRAVANTVELCKEFVEIENEDK